MPDINRVDDLEIGQDLEFQRREWTVERIGWAAMAVIILMALLGLFGTGPLNNTSIESQDGLLRVDYDRFARRKAPTLPLKVYIESSAAQDGEAHLWLDRNYLEGFDIHRITPQPDSVIADQDRLTYVFELGEQGQLIQVTFLLQPEQLGVISGQIGLEGAQGVEVSHFAYP